MTIDEKLELFYETTIQDATSKSREMVEEYEKEAETQLDEQKAQMKEKTDALYRLESEQLIHEKNKVISLVVKNVKKQVLEEEKSFGDILFGMVEEKLQAYMQTDEYSKDLIEQVRKAKEIAGEDDVIIYINGSDCDKKDQVEKETGLTLTVSDEDFIGGVRAVIKNRNLMIDNSYLARLNEEKEAYTM